VLPHVAAARLAVYLLVSIFGDLDIVELFNSTLRT